MRAVFAILIFILSSFCYGQTGHTNRPGKPDHTPFFINDYTPVLSFNACENKMLVEDATDFKAGDTVFIIQMKGALIDSSNTPAFGTVTDYGGCGNFEFNYVKSISG